MGPFGANDRGPNVVTAPDSIDRVDEVSFNHHRLAQQWGNLLPKDLVPGVLEVDQHRVAEFVDISISDQTGHVSLRDVICYYSAGTLYRHFVQKVQNLGHITCHQNDPGCIMPATNGNIWISSYDTSWIILVQQCDIRVCHETCALNRSRPKVISTFMEEFNIAKTDLDPLRCTIDEKVQAMACVEVTMLRRPQAISTLGIDQDVLVDAGGVQQNTDTTVFSIKEGASSPEEIGAEPDETADMGLELLTIRRMISHSRSP